MAVNSCKVYFRSRDYGDNPTSFSDKENSGVLRPHVLPCNSRHMFQLLLLLCLLVYLVFYILLNVLLLLTPKFQSFSHRLSASLPLRPFYF